MYNSQEFPFWGRSPAARIAIIYTAVSVLWIAFSDQILLFWIDDIVLIARLQTIKGWIFVLFSGGLLWFLIHSDYVVRRDIELKFRRSELRFRRIFECAGQGVWMLDSRGRTLLINNWFSEVLGWDLTNSQGMLAQYWLHKKDHSVAADIFRNVRQGVTVQREMQLRGETLLIHAIPLLNEMKHFDGLVIMVSNISELAAARNEVKHALHNHAVLLHEIHHRVRNNLQLVISLLNIQSRKAQHADLSRFVQQSESWVKTIAAAHHLAYESDTLCQVQLSNLVQEIVSNMQHYSFGSMEYELRIAPVTVSLEAAVTLGLLLNQLLYCCSGHRIDQQNLLLIEGVLQHELLKIRVPCAMITGEKREDVIQAELVTALASQLNACVYSEQKSEGCRSVVIEFPLQAG